jgi:collagenase-like PrtC family protease
MFVTGADLAATSPRPRAANILDTRRAAACGGVCTAASAEYKSEEEQGDLSDSRVCR